MSAHPIFQRLFADMATAGLLPGSPVPKHPLDNEQAAPFTAPTPDEVAAARDGIEAVKRRNREATPTPRLLAAHSGAEL